ncbi:hypothetical protein BH23CHL8_BH23CHL8_07920 [soil metagenome]
MYRRSVLVLLAYLAVFTLVPGVGFGAEPSPASSPAPANSAWEGEAGIVLSGPFGSVPGDPVSTLPSAAIAAALDAFVLGAPLRLEAGRPAEPMEEWLVTGSAEEGGPATTLSSRAPGDSAVQSLRFDGPDRAGRHLITAFVVTAAGEALEGAWTLEVPDRPAPADGLLEVPSPELLASSSSGSLAGWPGSGCYVYLCVAVGRIPPLRTLERLAVNAGEPLRLRLSDGSRVATWEAAYLPILGGLQAATARRTGAPPQPVSEFTLPAPAPGEWLLMVEVGYDRERGWHQVFFRLSVAAATDQAPAPSGTASGPAGKRDVCASSGSMTPSTCCRARMCAQVLKLSK